MKIFLSILIVGLLTSCNFNKNQQASSPRLDSVNTVNDVLIHEKSRILKDTIITYSIDGVSTEGAGVEAKYINGEIKDCNIQIYGEMGKVYIDYSFVGDSIKAMEQRFTYKVYFTEVKSDEDIQAIDTVCYVIDRKGKFLQGDKEEYNDYFYQEFRKTVPFILK